MTNWAAFLDGLSRTFAIFGPTRRWLPDEQDSFERALDRLERAIDLAEKMGDACECGHAQNEHECGLCQVVLNEGCTDGRPIFCDCPQNDV